MFGKNRAFALAVATAALVGVSAPAASAAGFQGPSGFNNDSILNLSGNQLPTQVCTGAAPINTVTNTQSITDGLASILPSIDTGTVSPMQGNTCTQSPAQTNTTTADTVPTSAPSMSTERHGWRHSRGSSGSSSDQSTSGFNNDSILNISGNQLPVQTCTSGAAVNTVTATEALTGLLSILPVLNTGAVSPTQGNACTQAPTQASTSSANS